VRGGAGPVARPQLRRVLHLITTVHDEVVPFEVALTVDIQFLEQLYGAVHNQNTLLRFVLRIAGKQADKVFQVEA